VKQKPEVAILGKMHVANGVAESYRDYYFEHNDPSNNCANRFFKEGWKGEIGRAKLYSPSLSITTRFHSAMGIIS